MFIKTVRTEPFLTRCGGLLFVESCLLILWWQFSIHVFSIEVLVLGFWMTSWWSIFLFVCILKSVLKKKKILAVAQIAPQRRWNGSPSDFSLSVMSILIHPVASVEPLDAPWTPPGRPLGCVMDPITRELSHPTSLHNKQGHSLWNITQHAWAWDDITYMNIWGIEETALPGRDCLKTLDWSVNDLSRTNALNRSKQMKALCF